MDHSVSIVKSAPGSALLHHLQRYKFDSEELEDLYKQFCFKFQRQCVIQTLALLSFFVLVQCVFHFVFSGGGVTFRGLYMAFQCAVFLLLLLVLTYNRHSEVLLPTAIWVTLISFLLLAFFSFPINYRFISLDPTFQFSGADGVWEVALLVFLTHTMLPMPTWVCTAFGVCVPLCQLLLGAVLSSYLNSYLWQILPANVVVYAWANAVGIFVQLAMEKNHRKTFLDTRNSIIARLEIEDENEKLERLLTSILPHHIAMEMKSELRDYQPERQFRNIYIQSHKEVSILFGDIVGFSSLASQCTPQDLVRILNELFGRFDQLCVANQCMRVEILGDCYFCVSGLPQFRQEHAQCCVEMALDMSDTIKSVSETADLQIEMRVGIHSGKVLCGVLGLKRWQYDVWSEDVAIAKHLEASCQPGRILISSDTKRLLDSEYELEEASDCNLGDFLVSRGIKAYHVITPVNRKQLEGSNAFPVHTGSLGSRGHKRLSFRNVSLCVIKLLHSMKFHSEVPFSHVLTSHRDRPSKGSSPAVAKTNKKGSTSVQLKRILRKRHGSVFNPTDITNRVTRHLAQAIEARSVHKDQAQYVNWLSLQFKRREQERKYHDETDRWFFGSMICYCVALSLFAALNFLVLPRLIISFVLFLVSLLWVLGLIFILWLQRRSILKVRSLGAFRTQISVCLISVFLACIAGVVNSYSCPISTEKALHEHACFAPHYILISCLILMLSMSVFLKLPALIRFLVVLVISIAFSVQIFYLDVRLFENYSKIIGFTVPLHASGLLAIIISAMFSLVQARQSEWCQRLDYLWKIQAAKEKFEMSELQKSNQQILYNLLPAHVACHFLDNRFVNTMDLYSQGYASVGVMFADICNFTDFYVEMDRNGQAVESMRLLNEIICDFDEVVSETRFRCVDKIKTVGSTYMAAVGLVPEQRMEERNPSNTADQLTVLVEFVLALQEKLVEINEHSMNDFCLKTGISVGPVVAGVIGARKPQYDLWGSAVNVCWKLQLTGLQDCIQVTEDVYLALRSKPYAFRKRSVPALPNKEIMTSYFITGRKHTPDVSERSSASRGPSAAASTIDFRNQTSKGTFGGFPTSVSQLQGNNNKQQPANPSRFKQSRSLVCEDDYTESEVGGDYQSGGSRRSSSYFDAPSVNILGRPYPNQPMMPYSGNFVDGDVEKTSAQTGVPQADRVPLLADFSRDLPPSANANNNILAQNGKKGNYDNLLTSFRGGETVPLREIRRGVTYSGFGENERRSTSQEPDPKRPTYLPVRSFDQIYQSIELAKDLEKGLSAAAPCLCPITGSSVVTDTPASQRDSLIGHSRSPNDPLSPFSGLNSTEQTVEDEPDKGTTSKLKRQVGNKSHSGELAVDSYKGNYAQEYSDMSDSNLITSGLYDDCLRKPPPPAPQPSESANKTISAFGAFNNSRRKLKKKSRRTMDNFFLKRASTTSSEFEFFESPSYAEDRSQNISGDLWGSTVGRGARALRLNQRWFRKNREDSTTTGQDSTNTNESSGTGLQLNGVSLKPVDFVNLGTESNPLFLDACNMEKGVQDCRKSPSPSSLTSNSTSDDLSNDILPLDQYIPSGLNQTAKSKIISRPAQSSRCSFTSDTSGVWVANPLSISYRDNVREDTPQPLGQCDATGAQSVLKELQKGHIIQQQPKQAEPNPRRYMSAFAVVGKVKVGQLPPNPAVEQFNGILDTDSPRFCKEGGLTGAIPGINSRTSRVNGIPAAHSQLQSHSKPYTIDDVMESLCNDSPNTVSEMVHPLHSSTKSELLFKTSSLSQIQPSMPPCSNCINTNLTDDLSSPLHKPFPLEEPPYFIDSPDIPSCSTSQPVSSYMGLPSITGAVTQASVTSGTGTGATKLFSETEYENVESDCELFSESESAYLASSLSPETKMLQRTRLLVPGYNLSLTSANSDSIPFNINPRSFGSAGPSTRDDSALPLHGFGGPSSYGSHKRSHPLQSLDYLGIDTGNEADIDSLSSRCSSHIFEDYTPDFWPSSLSTPGSAKMLPIHLASPLAPRPSLPNGRNASRISTGAYDSEYDNFRPGMLSEENIFQPEPISDMEIDFFDRYNLENLRQVTADIQKSFGNVQLNSYSDGATESDPNK